MAAEAEFGQRPLTDLRKTEVYVRVALDGQPETARLGNTATVNATFACEVEFFVEQGTGNILLPQDWEDECAPPPELYFIKKKVWPTLEPDSLEQDEYRGTVQLVADYVPPEVDSRALTVWLLAGLDDDDPEWVATKVGLDEARNDLRKADELLEAIPKLKIAGVKTIAEEVAIKTKRTKLVAVEKKDAEIRIDTLTRKIRYMQAQRDDPLNAPFYLEKVETHKPIETNCWAINFTNPTAGARLAYLATHKYNWGDFKVAFHKHQSKPPKATKQIWDPPLAGDFQEVNMRAVRVARRKHGRGMYKFPDDRGYYSGSWLRGLRHGMGVTIDMQGKFMGKYKKERRRGRGTLIYSNGDLVRGNYACPTRRLRSSLVFGDEYCDGLIEGEAVLKFADGSRYEGEVSRGMPHGKGVYTDSTGMKYEGMFEYGLPHGRGTRSYADVNQLGKFEEGELQGNGITIDLTLGRMEGQFNRSIPHGHMKSTVTQIKGSFDGYYMDGLRTGFGRLDFGNIDRDEKMQEEKLKKRKHMHNMTQKERLELQKAKHASGAAQVPDQPDVELSDSSDGEASTTGGAQPMTKKAYEEKRERKMRRRRKRRAKRQASFNRFVRGGGGASSAALSGTGGADEEDSNSSSDEDVYGRKKGQMSEYDKYDDYDMPYRGDFGYEGWLRANCIWNNGVFVSRKGKPVHHAHYRYYAHRLRNVSLPPELSVLAGLEQRVVNGRIKIQRNTVAEAVGRRLTQESDNIRSYRYWRKIAKLNMAHYRTRNQQLQRGIRELKDSLIGDKSAAAWEKAAGVKQQAATQSEDFIQTQDDTVQLYQEEEDEAEYEAEPEAEHDAESASGDDSDAGQGYTGFAHSAYGDDVDVADDNAGL